MEFGIFIQLVYTCLTARWDLEIYLSEDKCYISIIFIIMRFKDKAIDSKHDLLGTFFKICRNFNTTFSVRRNQYLSFLSNLSFLFSIEFIECTLGILNDFILNVN